MRGEVNGESPEQRDQRVLDNRLGPLGEDSDKAREVIRMFLDRIGDPGVRSVAMRGLLDRALPGVQDLKDFRGRFMGYVEEFDRTKRRLGYKPIL